MTRMNKTSNRGPERTVYLDPLFAIADACVIDCLNLLNHVFRDRFKATR
jgi:hypothetical protein